MMWQSLSLCWEAAVDGPVTLTLMSSSPGTWVRSENLCKVDTSPASLSPGPGLASFVWCWSLDTHSHYCVHLSPGPSVHTGDTGPKKPAGANNGKQLRHCLIKVLHRSLGMHSTADLIINFVHLKLKVQVVFGPCAGLQLMTGRVWAGHDQSLSRRVTWCVTQHHNHHYSTHYTPTVHTTFG